MGLFKKKKTNSVFDDYSETVIDDLEYNGVHVVVTFRKDESLKHVYDDFRVLEEHGIERIIREEFIPWLVSAEFKDRDRDKICEGLKISHITYTYGMICGKYSPTGADNYFGQFELDLNSCSDYTEDMLQQSAIEIYILDGKIVGTRKWDV